MYGMVNKAVEDMVVSHHGEATWLAIKQRAGVDNDFFISNESYPDDLTYRLVGAASEVLAAPAEQILFAFGEYWVLETARKGYGAMMDAAGRDLGEFLAYLPRFHDRVVLVFPRLQPPRFEITEHQGRSLHLHYYSHREGLTPFALGLVSGLGKMFNTPARVSVVQQRSTGGDHDEFLVEW
jgi:hypothetical protein